MHIIGLPNDTEETYLKTLSFLKRILSNNVQFNVFNPYHEIPVFQNYKDKIITSKYENFNQWKLVFNHDHLNQDKVKLLDLSYRKYYLTFNWIYKNSKKFLLLW